MPPADAWTRLEELRAGLEELERRISALEHRLQAPYAPPHAFAAPPTASPVPGEIASPPAQLSVLSIFGRAVLGIAGAYLLRAVAESRAIPPWIAVALAVAYAAAWLVWSAWPGVHAGLTRSVYATTAALILSPLLWEATLRFQLLAPPVTAAVLAAFALLSMALAWRYQVRSVLWVGTPTAVLTALVLMAPTRALVPFAWALLVMALGSEILGGRGKWLVLRTVVAVAADLALVIVVLILGDLQAIPSEYQPAGAAVLIALVAAPFVIYAASLTVRSVVLRLGIRVVEAVQFAATVLLASWAVLRITAGAGQAALGVCCLVAGAACYAVAFGLLSRHRERPNFHFYATCGIVFILAGSFLALPPKPLVIWLCLAAAVATALGVRARSPALDLHGVAYLSGAVFASGLLGYAGRALAGASPSVPGALPIVAAATALLCAAVVSRYSGEHPGERLLRLLPAVLAVYATAGLVVAAMVQILAHGATLAAPQLAVLRTLVTCATALLLARAGARLQRVELVWMAYAAAALGSLKLVVEDLRLGSAWALSASLLIYGAVLLLIPRLVRGGAGGHR